MLKTNENTRCGIHAFFIFELSEFLVINSQVKCNLIVMEFK